MTEDKNNALRRDTRLLVSLSLLFLSLVAWGFQAWIVKHYLDAAITGDWTHFSEMFSVEPPTAGPDFFCFDYCAAELPLVAGWIGIASFLLGVAILVYSWWKPRSGGAK